jgi:hypothetical protein
VPAATTPVMPLLAMISTIAVVFRSIPSKAFAILTATTLI